MDIQLALLLLTCGLVGVIATLAGAGAAYLARQDEDSWPTAITRAAVAWAATVTLVATVAVTLSALLS